MIEKTRDLEHLAIIMDGNRRWAKSVGKTIKDGHKAGANKLTEVIEWCIDFGIKYLTVYAFSIENWKRDSCEVNDIMSLLRQYLSSKSDDFDKKNVKIKTIGSKNNIDADILSKIIDIEEKTKNNDAIQVNIAFNYSGREEILDATRNIAKLIKSEDIKLDDIDERLFCNSLYYGCIPEPDLVIRTGGDLRVSNFLLWEIAYSEFYFADVFWPDFSKELLDDIINNFKKRERRYGGTIKK